MCIDFAGAELVGREESIVRSKCGTRDGEVLSVGWVEVVATSTDQSVCCLATGCSSKWLTQMMSSMTVPLTKVCR